eukprot:s2871_g5.t1
MTTPTTDTRSTTLQDGGDAATTVTMNMFMLVCLARLPVPSRRPSATAEPSPAKVVDVPKVQPKAPAAKAAEAPPAVSEETPLARLQSLPRSELPTHWAQVDTLYLSWDMLLAVGTQLIVRGHWVGKDKETQTPAQPYPRWILLW